ncbi:MAG: hydantoinase/oxoprolinase family protein, partial [Thermoplasmatota archaeon]
CMGYIDPDYFLGGKMELNENKARSALEFLADELKMDFDETLLGIYKIANTKMARTMKKITVERGLDPEKFTILAFGGAGPLHAAYLAEEMDISHVIVPPMPGVFSALGMATGDIVKDYSRTLITPLSNRERIDRVIEVMNMESVGGEKQILLGLRYKGQSYHINIPYTEDIEESFHREHEKKYGYSNTDAELEVVRVHIEIRKERDFYYSSPKEEDIKSSNKRVCLFPKGKEKADVYYREGFVPENKKKGPCIIEDRDSTLLVPPKWFFTVDKNKIVHMEKIE